MDESKEAAPAKNTRRPFRGLLTSKRKQLTYALLNLIFAFMIALSISFGFIYKLAQFSRICMQDGEGFQPPPAMEIMSLMGWASIIAVCLAAGACFFFILKMTHRFLGPLVPIRQQLEAMILGQYEGRVHLRKEDELQDIALLINSLAEKLQKNSAQK